MNELVQKYLDKTLEEHKKQLLDELGISRVYEGEDSVKGYEYPFNDSKRDKKYRLRDIQITDEEYFKLLEYSKEKRSSSLKEEPTVGGWYIFGVIFIILTALAGFIIMFSGDMGIGIGVGIIISGLLTGAPMILLSNIEYQLKKLNAK